MSIRSLVSIQEPLSIMDEIRPDIGANFGYRGMHPAVEMENPVLLAVTA
jgi:hypothetical protein